jgi:hypothetical protein
MFRVVTLQELPPTWGWASIVARIHVLGDSPGSPGSPGGHCESQSRQFGLDSFLTPEPLNRHPPDESLK